MKKGRRLPATDFSPTCMVLGILAVRGPLPSAAMEVCHPHRRLACWQECCRVPGAVPHSCCSKTSIGEVLYEKAADYRL